MTDHVHVPVTPAAPSTMNSAESDGGALKALVARCVGGDDRAVSDLLERVRPMVLRYCRARLGRHPGAHHAADDAAQEVCIAVLAALPRYRDEGRPFEAFVFGVAAHKVADVQRAAVRAPTLVEDMPDAPVLGDGPEDLALRSDEATRLRTLLDRLPPLQREIVLLRVAVGLSAEETGRAVGMSPGAVRVAQHRALGRLRTFAEQEALA